MLSPPIQIASAPRPTSEATASRTAAEPSTFASSSSIPSSLQTARASFVPASEFASDGFQATPTLASRGASRRAIRKPSATGCIVPRPTMYGGCFLGSSARDADAGHDGVAHHPEDVRSLRVPVGPGDRLEAGRGSGDDQLVVAPDDRPGDRIRRRGVPLGVVPVDPERPAFPVSRLRQPRQHAPDPLLDGRLRDVLEERDRADPRRATRTRPASPRPAARSRSVSSNTADAARIKNVASHNRRKLLIIHESGCGEDVHQAGTGSVTTPAGSMSRLDLNRAVSVQPQDPRRFRGLPPVRRQWDHHMSIATF